MKYLVSFAGLAAALCVPLAGQADPTENPRPSDGGWVQAHVSSAGLEFLEQALPSLAPEELEFPEMSGSFSCLEAAQRDTSVQADLHDVSITIPRSGAIRIELEFSGYAEGEIYVNGCDIVSTACVDSLTVDRGIAEVELELEVSNGKPSLDVHEVEIGTNDELGGSISVTLSDCPFGDWPDFVQNLVDEAVERLVLRGVVLEFAAGLLTPLAEDLLVDMSSFDGKFGPTELQLAGGEFRTEQGGLLAAVSAGLESQLSAPAGCLEDDAPPPEGDGGPLPDLTEGVQAHAAASLDLGLVNDILYNVWRAGLMCLSDAYLEVFGIDLELDRHVAPLVPGFPPDTEFGIEVRVMQPPRVTASAAEGARVTLVARQIEVDLVGRHSDGQDEISVMADLEATAEVSIDHDTRSLILRPAGIDIQSLRVDDWVGGESLGLDAARLVDVLENHLAPKILKDLGDIPLTDSIVGFEGVYVLVRDLFTTDAHVGGKLDLFVAPEDDTTPPATSVESRPEGLVGLNEAVVRVSGSDAETPEELLRYRAVIDGDERELTFNPEIQIGQPGQSGPRRVEVSAVDLAGNEDPDPVVLNVEVDGKPPVVAIDGGGTQTVSGGDFELSWSQSDDLTPAGELEPRVELYRIRNPTDLLDVELVDEAELSPGATAYDLSLEPGELYRAEVRVRDQAGNEAIASARLRASAGGCAAGAPGAGGAGVAMFVLAFALLASLRRRGAKMR